MSYILEALKKAQAERQLGNAPTIHAPQPVQAAHAGAAAGRRPLLVGLGAGALVVVLGGLFLWQRAPLPAAGATPGSAPASGPASAPAAAATTRGASPVAPAASAHAAAASPGATASTLEVSAPPSVRAAEAPAHAAEAPPHAADARGRAAEASLRATPSTRAGRAGAELPAAGAAARAAAVAPPSTPPVASRQGPVPSPAPEDSLPYLHQLADSMQRELPRVSFGGYLYSANPADRLLLVDKTLRHEGEEVAPGLVLEKLLPKAAVMNYRGLRYRVAY